MNKKIFETKEEERMKDAILIILYEQHPIPMSQTEIIQKIEEKGLLEMSDEEFKTYRKNIVNSKKN